MTVNDPEAGMVENDTAEQPSRVGNTQMVILSSIGAQIIQLRYIDGKSEQQIADQTNVLRKTVNRILTRFKDRELPVIMGVNYERYTKGYIRDCVIRLLQNAELVRESLEHES